MRFSALLGSLAVLGSVLAGSTLAAAPANAAPGDPFPAADPLVFVAQGVPTTLYRATTDSTGTVSFQPEGSPAPVTYNAISYNTADNYLYGIVGATGTAALPANSLVRIGQGGVVTRVGTSTYTQYTGWNAGAFGADGLLYIARSGTANTTMLGINPTTGAVARTVTLSSTMPSADITYANGYFWGEAPTPTGAVIIRINPANGALDTFPAPFFIDGTTDFAGAAWTFGNGNLGFSENTSGAVLQVRVTNPTSATPTFTLVSQTTGPASSSNDGAASPGQPTDLALTKTGPQAVVPGGTVSYTLTVKNNGPGNSSGYTVSDTIPAPLTNAASTTPGCTVSGNTVTCVGGRLLAGDTASYAITASVPAGTTAAIGNTATVTPNEQDPTPGNNTSTHTVNPAGLSIVKHAGTPVDVNGDGLTDAGDTIQYTFTVTNTGLAPVTGVVVNDDKAGAVSCPQTSLAPGDVVTCSADSPYTITAADVTAGAVNNTATATAVTPDGVSFTSTPSTTSTPTTAPAPALTVVKSADPSGAGTFQPGQVITYHFVVTNTGNVPMTGVTVNEGAFTGTGSMSQVTCPTTTLAVGAQTDCTATYTLTDADVNSGSVTNTATAEGTPVGGTTPIPSPPSTVTVPTPAQPGITITKSANPAQINKAGETVTYSFLVTNTGNVTLTGVDIADTDFSGTGTLSAIDCPSTTLLAGQFETCTATYTVTQADVDAGTLTNTATVTGTPPDGTPITPVPSNPNVVDIPRTPNLTLTKSADVQAAAVGQVVTYTFVVTNTGNVTIKDPQITETGFTGHGTLSPLTCPPGPVTLAPGDDITCTATYTVTQADVDAGSITNTASVTGTPPAGSPALPPVPSNTVTVPTSPHPALSVVKTADTKEITRVGQVVTYSFAVKNVGNVTITDPTIHEGSFSGHGKLSAITCPSGHTTLAPGEDVTCTATYTVVAADLDGALTNTATVSGDLPGGGTITSDPSTATTTANPPTVASVTPTGLAQTGSSLSGPAMAVGFLLLALGAVMLVVRRRRNGEA